MYILPVTIIEKQQPSS